ncbi:MAG TPA: sulfite exporter TauE/SafE family protein [Puia sp.]|nr:sulfite exporter TauE/SafE family protein [Puia sp.]
MNQKRKIPILYFIFLAIVLVSWLLYTRGIDISALYSRRWPSALTMIFGSFIAGSSPEGSAAISYPIFTLLLNIPPAVARNFSFAIQSIGMTSATLLILGLHIKVEWNYIKFVTLGGIFGLVFGTYQIVPLVSPIMAKLFFVSLWLSFGIALWIENGRPARQVFDEIRNFNSGDIARLIAFGFIGGIISSLFGTGINIFTYCIMTIYYGVSEKVATPSSVIIMTIETILGFFLHAQIIKDFQPAAFEMWLACVPIVALFAPLGAFVVSKLPRKRIAQFLYIILFVQFFGAMWVIRPTGMKLIMCFIVFAAGLGIFNYLAKVRKMAT